jgi:hypothetical protein
LIHSTELLHDNNDAGIIPILDFYSNLGYTALYTTFYETQPNQLISEGIHFFARICSGDISVSNENKATDVGEIALQQ